MTSVIESSLTKTKAETIFNAVWDNTLDFQVELDWDVAMAFIDLIERYNDFESTKVKHALELIDLSIKRNEYGPINGMPNPNHGRRDIRIKVGRERSPVIYIERYELLRMGTPTHPLTSEKIEYIKSVMQEVGIADEADCEIQDYTSQGMGIRYKFRFWWD